MLLKTAPVWLLLIFACLSFNANAQKWKIIKHTAGIRSFEVQTNVKGLQSVVSMIRDKETYLNMVNSINYTGFSNIAGVYLKRKHFLWMAEWEKSGPESKFWKKYSVLTGLLITDKKQIGIGSVSEDRTQSNPLKRDRYAYSIEQVEQSVGAIIGLNRHFKISGVIDLVTGIQLQGNYSFKHYFNHKTDSGSWTPANGWQLTTTHLPKLEGEKYIQWQLMIPLGVELKINHTPFSLRLEAIGGITNDQFRKKNNSDKSILGLGAWLIYRI